MSLTLGMSERAPHVFEHELSGGFTGVRAVLFDVDGTLYAQTPLRLKMAAELAVAGMRAPRKIARDARILATFRRMREELRQEGDAASRPLDVLQFARPAARLGIDAADIEQVVDEWIMQRPLKHLRSARRPGLGRFLSLLADRGLRVGALSDYPVHTKLRALGVADYFSLGLCTADRPINAFKPHPGGFRHACELWGVAPQEVLYVGDRPETDGAGAAAAGIRCVIVGRGGNRSAAGGGGRATVAAFTELTRAFVAG
jgi:HAD superfamily hydrolase (TIGR01549 family)